MVRRIVQKSHPSSNLGGQRSKAKVTRDKKLKSVAFFRERSLRAQVASSATFTPMGKSPHAV